MDVTTSPLAAEKTEGTVALVKSDSEKKTTPAGEYLTAALNEFDPEQYESLAAISDGANKLLMLVCFVRIIINSLLVPCRYVLINVLISHGFKIVILTFPLFF